MHADVTGVWRPRLIGLAIVWALAALGACQGPDEFFREGPGLTGTAGTEGSAGTRGTGTGGTFSPTGTAGTTSATGTAGTTGSAGTFGRAGSTGTAGTTAVGGTMGPGGQGGHAAGATGTSGTGGATTGAPGTGGSTAVGGRGGATGSAGAAGGHAGGGASGTAGRGGASGSGAAGSGGVMGTGPCAGLCANPMAVPPMVNSGDLGTGATCDSVVGAVTHIVCGNFVAPRTMTVERNHHGELRGQRKRPATSGPKRRLVLPVQRRPELVRLLLHVLTPSLRSGARWGGRALWSVLAGGQEAGQVLFADGGLTGRDVVQLAGHHPAFELVTSAKRWSKESTMNSSGW